MNEKHAAALAAKKEAYERERWDAHLRFRCACHEAVELPEEERRLRFGDPSIQWALAGVTNGWFEESPENHRWVYFRYEWGNDIAAMYA